MTNSQTVRFSRATVNDLEDMGVKANSPGAEPIELDGKMLNDALVASHYVSPKSFKAGWERQWVLLCENLWPSFRFFGDKVRFPLEKIIPEC